MKSAQAVGRLTRNAVRGKDPMYAYATVATQVLGAHAEPETEFIDLVFTGADADTITKYGTLGRTISVNGSERLKTFQRRDGSPGATNEIFVAHFDFIDTATPAKRS